MKHSSSPARSRLVLLAAFVLILRPDSPVFGAGEGPLRFNARTWQIDEGLPNNSVQAIAQTQDGYLWVGTGEGLARFDGTRFNTIDARNTPALGNSNIKALCADRTGALWIGSDGGGLARLKDGVYAHFGKADGLAGDNIRAIYEDRDGAIWIGTLTGMSRFKDGTFTSYTRLYFAKGPSLISSIINSITEDREGNIWAATSGGLNRLNGQAITVFTNELPNKTLRMVFQDTQGRLWIGSNSGLAAYENGAFHSYTIRQGLSDNFVTSICEDREGNLWVGGYGGLNRLVNGKFITEANDKGEPYDQVNTIFEDREGSIWAGSKEGLIQFTPRIFSTFAKQQGLNYNNIMSVSEDRAGALWIATWGGGLNRFRDGQFSLYEPPKGIHFSTLLSTCESRDGGLWVGADFDGGLTRLVDGEARHYTAREGLIASGLKVIHEDRSGNVWIGTHIGLSLFKDGNFTSYNSTNSNLAGDNVRAICEDHAGGIWFGTDGGVSRWADGHFINFTTKEGLSDNVVNALYEDKEQNLWLGTESGGLDRYKDNRFFSYTTQRGLFSDRILEILEDDRGWLWLSCYRGVFRVRKSNLDDMDVGRAELAACIAYGKVDGMESAQCNGVAKPAGWKTKDGRLWFPTTKGLVVADPNLKLNEVPPPVLIEEIIADKKTVELEKWRRATAQKANGKNPDLANDPFVITVPPGAGELEFQYGALSFSSPEKDRFKYRLEGVDSDWIDAGTRRIAHYNNIFPGRYRFRVKAANNDGIWNETGAVLALELMPHFWQTKWFLAFTTLAAFGLVGGAVRYTSGRKLRQKLALLELQHSLEKERARIARDIHDDLGCSITQITLLSDESENEDGRESRVNTRKIAATAREMARSLDEIVWAINPEHDTLEGLVEYLTQSADEFLEDTAIRSRLKAPPVLPRCAIAADVRHDLFFAFKEAMNNAVRHARASEIQIEFAVEPGRFQIIIADDGIGFEPILPRAEGNGLKNMRQRLETVGGQFEISSQPGRGTKIKMTIRVKETGQ